MRAESRPASGRRRLHGSRNSSRRDVPPSWRRQLAAWSHDRGWRFLQAGDLRNAEREFGAGAADAPTSTRAGAAAATSNWRERSRARRWASSTGRSPSALTTSRRSSAGAKRCSTLQREAGRDCRVRTRSCRRPVADRRPPARRGAEVPVARARPGAARQAAQAGAERRGDSVVSGRDRASPDSAFLYRELGLVERRARRRRRGARALPARRRAGSDRMPRRSAQIARILEAGASMPRRFACTTKRSRSSRAPI